MRNFKIFLSILFVVVVSFFVIRGCGPKKKPFVPTPPVKKTVVQKKPLAKMAIILDDWGNSESLLDDAIAIARPLTLAVLPNLPHSRSIAEKASAAGLGVMLHMPMQPEGKNAVLEPHTIRAESSEKEVLKFLEEGFASVGLARGMNNHQGSKTTSDSRVMKIVMTYLKEKNLFFVDSSVTPQSVAAKIARQTGVPTTKRDVFIDNENNLNKIKLQLWAAKKIALKRGRVVVIGHDRPLTLRALRQILPEIEQSGIRLVLVQELLE